MFRGHSSGASFPRWIPISIALIPWMVLIATEWSDHLVTAETAKIDVLDFSDDVTKAERGIRSLKKGDFIKIKSDSLEIDSRFVLVDTPAKRGVINVAFNPGWVEEVTVEDLAQESVRAIKQDATAWQEASRIFTTANKREKETDDTE